MAHTQDLMAHTQDLMGANASQCFFGELLGEIVFYL